MSSPRLRARIIGAFFLVAFLLYGVGSAIATSAEPGSASVTIGVVMMLLNSVVVVAIGVLMLPILRPHSPAAAIGYAIARALEAVALAASAIALLSADLAANALAYNLGMTVLGVGSLLLCAVLFRARLVPRFLAVWGFAGYLIIAGGSVLELVGVSGAGLAATVPGGLFELVFGIWLIVRGFRRVTDHEHARDQLLSR